MTLVMMIMMMLRKEVQLVHERVVLVGGSGGISASASGQRDIACCEDHEIVAMESFADEVAAGICFPSSPMVATRSGASPFGTPA